MKPVRILVRAVAATALAAAMLGTASGPAAATHPQPAPVPFFADHTRDCVHMFTEGKIAFGVAHWGETQRVDVAGVLAERQPSSDWPDPVCDVAGTTFATFEAYINEGRELVDREQVWLNDPTSPQQQLVKTFEFSLFNTSPLPDIPIDRVDVTVCRDFGPWLPAFTCGETQSYPGPVFVPQDG